MLAFDTMFEELREAWRQAVENFQRELHASGASPDSERLLAMRRDLAAAAASLGRVETECRRAQDELTREREQESVCRRREEMARRIGDDETADIAAEFAAKHAERAAVLERVVAALGGECDLRRADVDEMRKALDALEAEADRMAESGIDERAATAGIYSEILRDRNDIEFQRMERDSRERAAEQRLEELKRRTSAS